MLWMETFCFYCSVRLGVIASASYSVIQALICILMLAFYGTSIFKFTRTYMEKNEQQNQDAYILRIIDEVTGRPVFYVILFSVFNLVQIVASVSAIYGAFKLQKMYLIPYMTTQFIVFVGWMIQHIFTMILLKKNVNLGILIGMTLAGGFYILYLGYSWAGAVALFQIIILVHSLRYKILYGDDPMAPVKRSDILPKFQEINKNLMATPKQKQLYEEKEWKYGGKIISVIPYDQNNINNDIELVHFNNWHWNELVGFKRNFK